jgi:two-component system chemotaxis sensor kinase CheA
MEAGLLQLRSAPDDIELLNAIFRSAHSIKGGAGSFGLTNLVRFTHALENLLDRMRASEIPATENVIGLLLESVDVLRAILEDGGQGAMPAGTPELLARLEELVSGPAGAESAAPAAKQSEQPTGLHRYRVRFHPDLQMFSSGTNPLLLVRNLGALGTVHACEIDTAKLPALGELDPSLCYLAWTVDLSTAATEAEIREVFEFVEHLAEVTIEAVETQPASAAQATPAEPAATEVPAAQAQQPAAAAAPAQVPRKADRRAKPAASAESSSIRVSTDKVDRLIDLVGELVIAHVMTEQMVEKFTPGCLPQLRQAVAAMERNTRELHERVMSIRMMPVGSLFQRFPRTVYDIAQATGKQIALELAGEETEIDKSMLELLGDPLTHLIRNAADHGIEAPEVRKAAGKPEQGKIKLSACHRSGRIAIEITDDGAGIDLARVRAKAVERGLIQPEAQLTDQQIRMLIFEPGFSTRDQVSDFSGRGGMDVVKRNIQQLNGAVTLTSEHGFGSKVTIELPLTLAIVEGLLVRVRDRTLVLPLLSVVETVSPGPGQIVALAGRGEAVMIHGESVAVLRLAKFLGFADYAASGDGTDDPNGPGAHSLIVVVESGAKKIGLLVDELLGQQQVVLKSLERHLHKVEGLMGATILGDGCVAPIVDVLGIANLDLFSLPASAAALNHSSRDAQRTSAQSQYMH